MAINQPNMDVSRVPTLGEVPVTRVKGTDLQILEDKYNTGRGRLYYYPKGLNGRKYDGWKYQTAPVPREDLKFVDMSDDTRIRANEWSIRENRMHSEATDQYGQFDLNAKRGTPIAIFADKGTEIQVKKLHNDPSRTHGNMLEVEFIKDGKTRRALLLHNLDVYPEYMRPLIEQGKEVSLKPGQPLLFVGTKGRSGWFPPAPHVHLIMKDSEWSSTDLPAIVESEAENLRKTKKRMVDLPDWFRQAFSLRQKKMLLEGFKH